MKLYRKKENVQREVFHMKSDIGKGIEKAPHRSLFKAMGYTDEEISHR